MGKELKSLEGKTIKVISCPDVMKIKDKDRDYETETSDDNIQIEFTDGTLLKLASWDYEGYSSGIHKEIVTP